MLKRLVAFAMPLIIVDAAVCLLQLSDSFLLDGLSGPHALGIYAIAYNLVERPISLICTAISTATFPVAVQMVHDHGTTLGARQASRNGAILFALALPACIGLAMTAPYVTAAMVGPDFRSGVQALVPVLCVAALFRGLSTHWVDHIFHLSGRTDLALWVYAPFAVANIGLNAVLIPRYGALGAAYASVACQAGALATGWTVGRRTFPVPFPLVEVIKICGAASVMALALYVVSFSPSWVGLLESVPVGATIFLAAALLLKIGNGQQTLRVLARRLLDMMNLGRGRAVL
jgi:O-antigen/teichoic acid export membrane protein